MAQPRCRSVLITGCSRGIGLGLVRGLAASSPCPELVFATCRYPEKAQVSGRGRTGTTARSPGCERSRVWGRGAVARLLRGAQGSRDPPGGSRSCSISPRAGFAAPAWRGPAAPRSPQIAAAPLASSACPSPFPAGLATTEEAQIDGFKRSSWQCPSRPGREQRLLPEMG